MKKNPTNDYLIGVFLIYLVMLTIIQSCVSREKILRDSAQHYEYGLLYLHAENWTQANEEFKKAAKLNPENDSAYFGLGLSLYFQGKFEEAIGFYQKAIEVNPDVPDYYNNIAASYAKLGKWEDVIHNCKIALENPSYSSPEFAYYNIGSAYLNLGQIQKAVEFLRKSKEQNPSYIDTYLQLAKALIKLGDFEAAISNIEEAKRLEDLAPLKDPALQAELEYYLGQSLLGLGDLVSANAAFSAVIQKDPNSALAKESAGHLKDLQGLAH